jgi:hypothetical protein
MKPHLDMDKIARGLRAERKGRGRFHCVECTNEPVA